MPSKSSPKTPKTSAALEQLESLRSAVWKILEKQIRARMAAAGILKSVAIDRANRQCRRRAHATSRHPKIIHRDSQFHRPIRSGGTTNHQASRLTAWRSATCSQPCNRATSLVKLKTLEEFNQPAGKLLAAQDRIIDVLRKLLDVARHAEDEVLAEMKKRPGSDLPDDAKAKARRRTQQAR